MDGVRIDTVGGQHLVEDGLGVGEVVMAAGPVAGVLQVGAVATGGEAGVAAMERRVAGQTQRTVSPGDVPAPKASPSHNVAHPLHCDVDEALRVLVCHLWPAASDLHLLTGAACPAVIVHHQGDGPTVGGEVAGGQVEAVPSLHLAQCRVLHCQAEHGVLAGLRLGGEGAATPPTGGGGGQGEDREEEQ